MKSGTSGDTGRMRSRNGYCATSVCDANRQDPRRMAGGESFQNVGQEGQRTTTKNAYITIEVERRT
jgi:hypothetical protein